MKEFLGRFGALCWWTAFALNTGIILGGLWITFFGNYQDTAWQVVQNWFLVWLLLMTPISLVGTGLCYLFRGTVHPMIEVRQ